MGRQRRAAWVRGCVVRVTWKELEELVRLTNKSSSFDYEKHPERVREILGEPRASNILADMRGRMQPTLEPVPEGEL